jgi:hypothetical protein
MPSKGSLILHSNPVLKEVKTAAPSVETKPGLDHRMQAHVKRKTYVIFGTQDTKRNL